MACGNCRFMTTRRGLAGLCYEPHHLAYGLRAYGHAPYRAAICPSCKHFQPFPAKHSHPGALLRAVELGGRNLWRAVRAARLQLCRHTAPVEVTQRQAYQGGQGGPA